MSGAASITKPSLFYVSRCRQTLTSKSSSTEKRSTKKRERSHCSHPDPEPVYSPGWWWRCYGRLIAFTQIKAILSGWVCSVGSTDAVVSNVPDSVICSLTRRSHQICHRLWSDMQLMPLAGSLFPPTAQNLILPARQGSLRDAHWKHALSNQPFYVDAGTGFVCPRLSYRFKLPQVSFVRRSRPACACFAFWGLQFWGGVAFQACLHSVGFNLSWPRIPFCRFFKILFALL